MLQDGLLVPTDAPRETPRGPASRVLPPLIIHASEAMAAVLDLALKASATDVKVLITGESGVGKDLVARYIHSHSSRAQLIRTLPSTAPA